MHEAECGPVSWDEAEVIVHGAVRALTGRGYGLSASHSVEDLHQEGFEALLRAAREFDPTRAVPFTAFARQSVSYALLQYMRRSDPLPERSRRDLRKVMAAEQDLVAAGVTQPSTAQVARHAGLPVQRVIRVKRERYEAREVPFSSATGDWDFPGLTGDTPEDRYLLWEARGRIRTVVNNFTTRQQDVFVRHFLEGQPVTAVANELGVSKGRISQICREIRDQLKGALDGKDVAHGLPRPS